MERVVERTKTSRMKKPNRNLSFMRTLNPSWVMLRVAQDAARGAGCCALRRMLRIAQKFGALRREWCDGETLRVSSSSGPALCLARNALLFILMEGAARS